VVDTRLSEASAFSPVSAGALGVCHIASGDRWAGAETQLLGLLKELRKIPNLRLSAIFLNEGRPAVEARKLGIDVCVSDESRQSFLQIFSAASRFLANKNIQVLHSHRYKENFLAALLALRCHVPVHVSSSHGAPEPFKGLRGLKQSAIRALDRQVALHATERIISVSNELREQLIRRIPAAKVVTIHNGIDEEAVVSPLTAAEAKKRLGVPVDCPVVGTAGRLERVKRLDVFLAAAKQVVGDLPDIRFVIAGDGAEASRLRRLVTDLELGERVLFIGHRDDIYDVIRAMDIFVLCSDHEGLPMALLEALFLGVAVVARPVGGVAEVIQDGVSGVWVRSADPKDLAQACVSLLQDGPRRDLLARAGAALVSAKFTARNTAKQIAAFYHASRGLQ
jgi:L-malate glycosyltransferase